MDYGKILSRSWNIVWGNKWLLVLGFLAALGSGGGSSSSNFNTSGSGGGGDDLFTNVPDVTTFWADYGTIILVVSCLFLMLGVVIWLLKLVGEAGMIASVDRIEDGEKMNLGKGFSAGTAQLSSMVGLSLILSLPTFVVAALFALIGFGAYSMSGDGGFAGIVFLCIIPLVCFIAIYGFGVQFIYPFAQRGVVLQGLGIIDGIRHGWQLLKENVAEIAILAIIFLAISFVSGVAIVMVTLPIILATLIPLFIVAVNGSGFSIGGVIFAGIGILVAIVIGAAIGSMQRALQSTAFTLGYREWTGEAGKLV